MVGELLGKNGPLEVLNLGTGRGCIGAVAKNGITSHGGEALVKGLETNTKLRKLHLGTFFKGNRRVEHNQVKEGVEMLVEMLKINKSLSELSLVGNPIKEEGYKPPRPDVKVIFK